MFYDSKMEKKVLKKEIKLHLKETHDSIIEQMKIKQAENQKLMLEKIEELKTAIKQAVKEEVECQLNNQMKQEKS